MLINCLETGKDIWSDLEKRLLQTKGSWRHRQWSCWLPCPKAVNRQDIQAIYWAWWDCNNDKMNTGAWATNLKFRTNFFSLTFLRGIFRITFYSNKEHYSEFLSPIFSEWCLFKTKRKRALSLKRPLWLLRSPYSF